ncbi:MAG TPA: hypothetical protein VI937_00595 [Negativicutes bacterium]|nr:hypothetical protein [Negativicutes bacterium]
MGHPVGMCLPKNSHLTTGRMSMRYRTMVTVLLVCCLLNLIGVVFTIRFMDEQDQTIRDQKALLKKSDQLISSQKNLITVREEQLEKYGQIKKDLEKTVDRYAVVIKTQEKTIAANEETIATAQKIHEIAMKIQVAQEEKIKELKRYIADIQADTKLVWADLEKAWKKEIELSSELGRALRNNTTLLANLAPGKTVEVELPGGKTAKLQVLNWEMPYAPEEARRMPYASEQGKRRLSDGLVK